MARKIGRYEIYGKIGSGAFGEVYRGHDPEVNRPVAVKVLSALSDADNLARFRREAAAAGNLHHRNIVTIYDSGENEGVPFIVMELVDGRDLQKEGAARQFSLLEKVEIMSQVAEGLHYAHINHIVHRDVKPANIMVLPDGSVKILDFGIARFNQSTAHRTRTGHMVGTFLYMSPEQFQDGVIDALSDIWAYGVVYYELLTGRHPFEAKENAGLMYKVTRVDPARIRSLAPDIPESLEQMVHRALARDRELRYQGLDDLQLDAHPVLMELRRERASLLMGEARAAFEAGQLDGAMASVRRILDLDPGKVEARQLRDQISKQMVHSKVRPRVDALLKSAEQEIGERRFGEAIESLESALRLDPDDSGIRLRLEEAKRLADTSMRAAELARNAERELRQRELPNAMRLCSEALRVDDRHPLALRLMQTIQQEMARYESGRRRQEALDKVRSLLAIYAFDEAFAAIENLRAEYPGDADVEKLGAAAKARQAELAERERLKKEEEQRRQREAEAIAEEQRRRREEDGFRDLIAAARHALAEQKFDAAREILRQALAARPADADALAVLQQAGEQEEKWRVEQQFAGEAAQCDALLRAGQLDGAAQALERAKLLGGNDARLIPLQDRLAAALAAKRRRDEIQSLGTEARNLIGRGRFDEAVKLLESAAVRLPDVADFPRLLAEAETGRQDSLRRQAIEQTLAAAAALVEKDQLEAALGALKEKLRFYPDSRELMEAASRVGNRVQKAQRERAIADSTQSIERLIAEKKWAQAVTSADAAQQQYPDAPAFAALKRSAEIARRQAEIEDVIAQASATRRQGNLAQAAEIVAAGRARYPDEQRLHQLFDEIDAAIGEESLAQARPLMDAGRFDEAETLVREALARRPKLTPAQDLLQEIGGRKAERLRQQRLRERAIAETRGGRNRRWLITGAAAVAAAGGVAWWQLRPPPQPATAPPSFWPYHPGDAVGGEPYLDTLNAHAGTRPLTYSLVKGALPAGIELDSHEGAVHGIPGAPGAFTFVVQVTDRDGRTAQHEFTITVKPPAVRNPDAGLVIENAGGQWTVVHGSGFSEYLHASGGSPPFAWSVSRRSLPRGLSLDPKSGRVQGTAVEDGVFSIAVKVTDSAGHSAESPFTITVRAKDEGPAASAPVVQDGGVPLSPVRGEHYTAALHATGGTGTITWSVQGLPRELKLDSVSGRIDGAFPGEGTFSFVARATDSAGKSGERAFTITVRAAKDQTPACQMKPYDYNAYGDLPVGTLTWSGNLATGAEVTVNGRGVTPGAFRGAADYLPADGAHIAVDVAPAGVKVKEAPSARNCWAPRLVLHNDGPAVSSVTIRWKVVP